MLGESRKRGGMDNPQETVTITINLGLILGILFIVIGICVVIHGTQVEKRIKEMKKRYEKGTMTWEDHQLRNALIKEYFTKKEKKWSKFIRMFRE